MSYLAELLKKLNYQILPGQTDEENEPTAVTKRTNNPNSHAHSSPLYGAGESSGLEVSQKQAHRGRQPLQISSRGSNNHLSLPSTRKPLQEARKSLSNLLPHPKKKTYMQPSSQRVGAAEVKDLLQYGDALGDIWQDGEGENTQLQHLPTTQQPEDEATMRARRLKGEEERRAYIGRHDPTIRRIPSPETPIAGYQRTVDIAALETQIRIAGIAGGSKSTLADLPDLDDVYFEQCDHGDDWVSLRLRIGHYNIPEAQINQPANIADAWAYMQKSKTAAFAGKISLAAHGKFDDGFWFERRDENFIEIYPFYAPDNESKGSKDAKFKAFIRYFFALASDAHRPGAEYVNAPANETFGSYLRSICDLFTVHKATGLHKTAIGFDLDNDEGMKLAKADWDHELERRQRDKDQKDDASAEGSTGDNNMCASVEGPDEDAVADGEPSIWGPDENDDEMLDADEETEPTTASVCEPVMRG
ncbi:hypothetical protein BDV96DRAFT_608126 [Lophiotrema nucula]|uniref:Uncharacterized protein n=1 Tax=Lophiotrema nucula TaxID=690887 RepID=A0A6A5YFR8_9PLEO|nr:hypothetical protein BDV96DRAFT_608126 [Lophiotrema nucula]